MRIRKGRDAARGCVGPDQGWLTRVEQRLPRRTEPQHLSDGYVRSLTPGLKSSERMGGGQGPGFRPSAGLGGDHLKERNRVGVVRGRGRGFRPSAGSAAAAWGRNRGRGSPGRARLPAASGPSGGRPRGGAGRVRFSGRRARRRPPGGLNWGRGSPMEATGPSSSMRAAYGETMTRPLRMFICR